MKKIFLVGVIIISFYLVPSYSIATPQLGVIDTDLLTTSGGTVPVGMDGFLFPSDGRITVWWGNEAGNIDGSVNVWIVTNAGSETTFTVGSSLFNLTTQISGISTSGNIDGYSQPYYGVNLGSINSNSAWISANNTTAPDLVTGSGRFYLISGVFQGSLPNGSWIFAIADADEDGIIFENGVDIFSPKTTSTVVPEPSTLLLLGAGLLGLGAVARRRKK